MTRTWIALGAFAVVLGISGAANAQSATGGTFGQRGQIIIGAERLTGFYSYNFHRTGDEPTGVNTFRKVDYEASGTQLNLLWGGSSTAGSIFGVNPAAIPRIGVDYMLTEMISLGGTLGYVSSSGSTKNKINGVSTDDPSYSAFAFAPRVGFAFRLTDVIAFWPRVGLTYYSSTVEERGQDGDTYKFSGFSAVGEAYFVISPVANFGFGVAPLLELPLSGTLKIEDRQGNRTTTTNYDLKIQNIGITAGLLGYF